MSRKIKQYIVILLLLFGTIEQGKAFADCWLTDLTTILKSTDGIDDFRKFIKSDPNSLSKFRKLRNVVGSDEVLRNIDVLNVFGRSNERIKALLLKFPKDQLLRFSDDFANQSMNVLRSFNRNPQLIESWKLLDEPWIGDSARKNIDEIKLVHRYFDDVTNYSGGYVAWRADFERSDIGIMLRNSSFRRYRDELYNDPLSRSFGNMLSVEEEAILKFYTTNEGYKNLNRALRGEIPMTDAYAAQERLMNQALSRLPNSRYSGKLFRIETHKAGAIPMIYKEGEIFTARHFMSTTHSEEALIEAMRARTPNLLIRIEAKSGKLIEDLSTFYVEKEILFKSGTRFRVKKVGISGDPEKDYIVPIKTVFLEEL